MKEVILHKHGSVSSVTHFSLELERFQCTDNYCICISVHCPGRHLPLHISLSLITASVKFPC